MRRQFLGCILAISAVSCHTAGAAEGRPDDYPAKAITVMVGYPAGGPTDALMRAIAPRLTAELHQPVLVDNRPGANEAIAAQLVSKAVPDGYTLLLSTETPLTQNQFLYRKLNYNPEKDFAPITRLITSPLALVVNASLPVNTLEEFVALGRSRPATRPLTYASGGSGSVLHLPMAMFAKQNGLNMLHVPYKGVAPLLTDLIGGQVESAWVAVAGAAPYVEDGRLKALVVDAPARVKALAQVPVFSETKVAPVQAQFIFALQAPTGTPAPVIDKLAAVIRKILLDPDFRQKNIDAFGYVVVASSPAELADYLAQDRPRQNERIKISGALLD
jgi:tripartite-type tricarboxylate transporter receptor subunit TctC